MDGMAAPMTNAGHHMAGGLHAPGVSGAEVLQLRPAKANNNVYNNSSEHL